LKKSRISDKIFAAKERKEHRDNDLCSFFFVIFVFFCGNSIFGCGFAALGNPRFKSAIRNPQSAIRNSPSVSSQTQSNPVKPGHASYQHLPKGLGFEGPSHIWWRPCQNAQSIVVCRYGGQVGRQNIGNSRILPSQTQSNSVKPLPCPFWGRRTEFFISLVGRRCCAAQEFRAEQQLYREGEEMCPPPPLGAGKKSG